MIVNFNFSLRSDLLNWNDLLFISFFHFLIRRMLNEFLSADVDMVNCSSDFLVYQKPFEYKQASRVSDDKMYKTLTCPVYLS